MLILKRKSNQTVVIGDNIEVQVLEIRGDQVSLGFLGPREIPIYRKEIFEAIRNENRQAASQSKQDMERLSLSLGKHFKSLTTQEKG